MISLDLLRHAMYAAMKQAAVTLPPDIELALRTALAEETDSWARAHLEASLENARLASEGAGLVCGDTGFPLFFVKAGRDCQIDSPALAVPRAQGNGRHPGLPLLAVGCERRPGVRVLAPSSDPYPRG